MKKLSSINFSDIISYPSGLIVLRELRAAGGMVRKVALSYDTVSDSVTPVPEQVYLSNKFGEPADSIASYLDDPTQCDSVVLPDGRIFVLYPSGECAMFDSIGSIISTGALLYRDSPVSSCSFDGKLIWTCAPEQNAILAYKTNPVRLTMRIGSLGGKDFARPVTIRHFDDTLFVCCEESRKIITVDTQQLTTGVYKTFREPVYNYMRVDSSEFVILKSGLYRL